MKYITNDECHSVLSTVGSMDKVKKAYSECSSGCAGAHYVFFENGRYHQLEIPLVPDCGRNHSFFLTVEYKDGSTKRHELWLFTNCAYDYSSAYDLIEERLARNDGLVSVLYGMEKDFSWTADTVWDKENGYQYDLQTYKGSLVDIRESYWTKPILLFTYKDSDVNKREEWVYCYREFDSIGMERLVKGEIKMTHTIKNFDEADDEIRNNAEYNKSFLSEAEKELKQIKDTKGHIAIHDGERLTTLGFGIPNLIKLGKVGYFPEQFLVELGLQGKTASEIEKFFISTGMAIDGDVIYRRYDNTSCFVDLKRNVFIKYDEIRNNSEKKFGRSIIMRESKRLSTMGFGIPNLIKRGEVGYFPEEFIKDFGLQEMTSLEIERWFLRSEIDVDGDIIGRWSIKRQEPVVTYFVNLHDNIFEKYDIGVPESNSLDGTFNYVDKTERED